MLRFHSDEKRKVTTKHAVHEQYASTCMRCAHSAGLRIVYQNIVVSKAVFWAPFDYYIDLGLRIPLDDLDIYIYVYIYIYIYIYAHTHTCIHAYIGASKRAILTESMSYLDLGLWFALNNLDVDSSLSDDDTNLFRVKHSVTACQALSYCLCNIRAIQIVEHDVLFELCDRYMPLRLLHRWDCCTVETVTPFRLLQRWDCCTVQTVATLRLLHRSDCYKLQFH